MLTKLQLLQLKEAIHLAWLTRKLKLLSKRPSSYSVGQPTIIGFMSSPTGLGYGARLIFTALKQKGFSPNAIDISDLFFPDKITSIPFVSNGKVGSGPLIFHVNGPELLTVMNKLGLDKIKTQKIIVVWAWEQNTLPKPWLKAEKFVDEIWASSHFLKNVFTKQLYSPVHYIPYPVAAFLSDSIETTPNNPDSFKVYTSFDPKSGLERKNPGAVIEIFQEAFRNNSRLALTVQISDPDWPIPSSWKNLKNVNVINSILTDDKIEAEIKRHDCVISLHRSEGFGFLIARALALGIPTIFTEGFGSNDFSKCPNAFLVSGVNYAIRGKQYSSYTNIHGQWIDPNLRQAQSYLEELSNLTKLVREKKAQEARHWWQSHYGLDSFINLIPSNTKRLFFSA